MRIPGTDSQSLYNERNYDEQRSLRLAWLVFAGWWMSLLWVVAGWFCVLMPPLTRAGMSMFGNMTRVVALRSPGDECAAILHDTLWKLDHSQVTQRPFVVRLLYTLAIGWWLSLLWVALGWAESLSIDRKPTGVARFMRLPGIMTLRRY